MYEYLKSLITLGGYKLTAMEQTIERHFVRGDISDSEQTELLQLAADHADDARDAEVLAALADLEQRVAALESAGIVVWKSGMITNKGQTVLYDVDKDGVLDRCRYDGGRASTSLAPGKIDGWVVTDAAGNVTGRIVRVDGQIIVEPVTAAAE